MLGESTCQDFSCGHTSKIKMEDAGVAEGMAEEGGADEEDVDEIPTLSRYLHRLLNR